RLGTGQSVEFDFGDAANPFNGNPDDDFVDIAITARVDNVSANQNGVVLSNGSPPASPVFVTFGTTPTRVDFAPDAAVPGAQGLPITVVEPALAITKIPSPNTLVVNGVPTAFQSLDDVVTFTVTLSHLPASTADAFDLVVTDTLRGQLTYVPGS